MLDPHALALSMVRLVLWLAILTAIFVPLERLFDVHPQKVFRKGLFVDLCYFFFSGVGPALFLAAPLGVVAWLAHQCVPAGLHETVAGLPLWARMALGLVAAETGFYWVHRLSHEIPFLWRFHAIHHSAEEMDFLVNTRAHPVDLVLSRLGALAPMYVLGLGGPGGVADSLVPVIAMLFGTFWGFFIHANVKWRFGPLEWLIATPAFHHWHHVKTGPIDRNYASTLPWLDWVFGTAILPADWPEDYGVKDEMPPGLLDQLAYPLLPPVAPTVAAESTPQQPAAEAVATSPAG